MTEANAASSLPASAALFSVAEIRAIEQSALAGLPPYTLMQRAGAAAAATARSLIADSQAARILIYAGPGNNGGDALEAACDLSTGGLDVSVLLSPGAGNGQSGDALHALQRAQSCAIDWITAEDLTANAGWTLLLDGLFGIGMQRPLEPAYRALVAYANALTCPVLAIDIASGLNADTGCIVTPADKEHNGHEGHDGDHGHNSNGSNDSRAIRATHTISFIGDKPGLHTCDGRDYSGIVHVNQLGVASAHYPQANAFLTTSQCFAERLQPRSQNSHKGSFGDVGVVGGADGMAGAVILAARAAAHTGAGRVYAGFVAQPPAYDALHPELMCRAAASIAFNKSVIAMGPGLGESREAHDLLSKALHDATHLVLDADALNMLAAEPGLQHKLTARHGGSSGSGRIATVLTPHPLEAARLLGIDTTEVQADRLHAARTLAQRFQAIVVLKGSGTVVARPDGLVAINPTGNPALATAGSGDVLSGVCAALLAQHWTAWEAAIGAVWLHGAAADYLVAQGIGPVGLCASELSPAVRHMLNKLITGAH